MADMKNNANQSARTSAGPSTTTSPATNQSVKTDLSYDDKVIEKIVGIATDDIPGVLTITGGVLGGLNNRLHVTDQKTMGIDAEVGKKQVALDLNVVVQYGQYVPEVFDTIVAKITKAVKEMTGLDVVECNMHVQDVMDAGEFQKTKEQQQRQKMANQNQQQGQQQQPAQQGYTGAPRVQ